ncbi:MAG: 2-C-methyl-D-erythritol 2,4-cyclodiphosphate synthase [Ignavibacteriaceae bacterium]
MSTEFRTGIGFDVHAFSVGRKLIIGGVEIPFEKGLLGHSDADVLLHAISDALLGALALGDIGKHFPDTDEKFKDADSLILLENVYSLIKEKGYKLGNIDSVVAMQKPKLSPYIEKIRQNICEVLDVSIDQISVKATTTEKLGFVGREEGVSSFASVLLIKNK